jgi:hypothetical protein
MGRDAAYPAAESFPGPKWCAASRYAATAAALAVESSQLLA